MSRFDLIEQSRTLNLIHDRGSDMEPEQYWIQLLDQPDRMGSLAVARSLGTVDELKLDNDQKETATRWGRYYL